MTPDEAVVAVIDALEQTGAQYMVVGSLASNFHGIPRSTRDADFVIELGTSTLRRLGEMLPAVLSVQPQASFETVTGTTRYVIVLAASPFVCELFVHSDDPHDRERMARRERVHLLGRKTCVATAEDMIVTKLRWADQARRSKDLDDVRNMIAVRGHELDWEYVLRWSTEHGTRELLERIRASIPPV